MSPTVHVAHRVVQMVGVCFRRLGKGKRCNELSKSFAINQALHHFRDVPKPMTLAHQSLFGPAEASRGELEQTKVGIKLPLVY